jgi:hypothetical protein
MTVQRPSRAIRNFEIAAWGAGVGLLLLALSPLFKWVNFASGGGTGLSWTDGKIVLGVTLVAMAVYITAMVKQKWLTPIILCVQAWGTLAVFWMGAFIWKVGSILDSIDAKENPFAALIATQISPGAGLYLGLFGGIVVAGSLGFIVVCRLLASGSLKPYYVSQGLSFALGILLAFFVGPIHSSKSASSHPFFVDSNHSSKSESIEMGDLFPGVKEARERAAAQEKWKETHHVSDKQWGELIANFKARKRPKSVSETDWWNEAKDKTPAQLNELCPPMQPHEWYRAEWAGGFSGSRELNRDFNFSGKPSPFKLTLKVRIGTEPHLPIKELHGHLAFVIDDKVIYETQVAEKPDVSFTDRCLVWPKIDPYDDNNPMHRTLRYAKDDELKPVFTVSKVVLADGTVKTFASKPPPKTKGEEERRREEGAKDEAERKAEEKAQVARKMKEKEAADRLADLRVKLSAAQREAEQAKQQAQQTRREADDASEKAKQADRRYRNSRSGSSGDAVRSGSAEAASRIQDYRDQLQASQQAVEAKRKAKELDEKAKQAEAKAAQTAKTLAEAESAVRQAEQAAPDVVNEARDRLAKQPQEKAARNEREAEAANASQFIGRWRITTHDEGSFFMTLDSSFQAQKTNSGAKRGNWKIVGNEAYVTWSDGWRNIINPQKGTATAFKPGTSWNDPPFSRVPAIKER